MSHKFENLKDALSFTFAGKATITLKSRKTDKHFTYRVKKAKPQVGQPEEKNEVFFVSVLGSCGEYSYIGLVTKTGFRLTKNSKCTADALSFRAFNYFFSLKKDLPYELEVYHEGTCGKCGRQLTHPESIEKGIGPECAKMFKISPVVQIENIDEIYAYDE